MQYMHYTHFTYLLAGTLLIRMENVSIQGSMTFIARWLAVPGGGGACEVSCSVGSRANSNTLTAAEPVLMLLEATCEDNAAVGRIRR